MWTNSVILLFIPLALCLKITEVYVPSLADVRGKAELRCVYELGSSRLNSVKWYKGELEFFRFTPHPPTITPFPVTGVHISISQSNSSIVTLYPLEYDSTGLYNCEVSTEAPHFYVDRKSANMTVMGIPKYDPLIEGVEPMYNMGEYVTANCTTAPSKPAARVVWFINDSPASDWLLENYSPVSTSDPHHLETRSVGLRFQIAPQHFFRHRLNLTCVASVQGLVKKSTVSVYPAELKNQIFAQERSRNSGQTIIWSCKVLLLTLFILLRCPHSINSLI